MIRQAVVMIIFGALLLPPTTSAKPSDENKYSEALLTSLYPVIHNAIVGYYGEPRLFMEPKILKVERLHEGEYSFNVTVQFVTFVGPHNPPYGKDTVSIAVRPGSQLVEKFHHEEEK